MHLEMARIEAQGQGEVFGDILGAAVCNPLVELHRALRRRARIHDHAADVDRRVALLRTGLVGKLREAAAVPFEVGIEFSLALAEIYFDGIALQLGESRGSDEQCYRGQNQVNPFHGGTKI